jgi:alpha-L-rhamnosidase
MADASVSAEGNYQYHWTGSLYTSWLTLMRDVQTEKTATCAVATGPGGDTNLVGGKPNCTGAVGDLTPGQTPAALPGDPSWMFAYPLVFSYQHRYFGDTRLATSLYPGIAAYTDFLHRMGDTGKGKTKGLVTWKKYGDWLEPGRVPSLTIIGEMSSGFNYGQTLRIARDTAMVLGHSDDAAKYEAALGTLKAAFHGAYWDPKKMTYGNGQQAAMVYALYLGAVPASDDAAVFAKLLASINTVAQPPDHTSAKTQQCGSAPCIDTGILATKWLMELLSIRGRTDVGLDLAFQTDYPSWGYMAAMNSTTVWEHWEYMNGPGMNSHAHPALASVGAWLYRWVAGIRLGDGTLETPSKDYGKGFKSTLFAPGCVTDPRLPSVTARITSLYGPIMASWTKASTTLAMALTLPTNTGGTVVFPAPIKPATTTVTEGGKTVWAANKFVSGVAGVLSGSVVDGVVTLEVGSGSYSFSATHK